MARSHHNTQNGAQFKIYELFTSGLFHLIFLNHGWLRAAETVESEAVDKEGRLYFNYEAPHTPSGDQGSENCLSVLVIEPKPVQLIVLKELSSTLWKMNDSWIICSFFLRALALS